LGHSAVLRVREKTTITSGVEVVGERGSVAVVVMDREMASLAVRPMMCAYALSRNPELPRVIGPLVLGQAEAELPEVSLLVSEKAVERVVEHRRYQLPHDQRSMVDEACTG